MLLRRIFAGYSVNTVTIPKGKHMNHVKRLMAFLLVLVMATGCAVGEDIGDGTLNIVCTIFPQYDFARSVAGDVPGVSIKLLIGSGQESHDYDPSSKDIAAVHDCDIFVYVGGESDSWVMDMLESVDTENKTVIAMMDYADTLESEVSEGMETEGHDHGAVDRVEYDEHVWTSPKNAAKIADAICDAMCAKLPESADSFRENLGKLNGELDLLDRDFRALASDAASPVMIVADRFPLLYFCREYGIEYYAAFSGCAASTEPSSKTVQFLIEKVKSENIPAVFKMDLSSGNVANTVAAETGARVLTFYSCHTVSTEDFDGGVTYVSLMQRNRDAIAEAFGVK